jgi:hypothetical protein
MRRLLIAVLATAPLACSSVLALAQEAPVPPAGGGWDQPVQAPDRPLATQKHMQKAAQKPLALQKPMQKAAQKPLALQKPMQKAAQKPTQKSVQKPFQKPMQKPTQK